MGNNVWATLTTSLSAWTLHPYRDAANGNLNMAAALYEWDKHISGALWVSLDHAKTAIINTIDLHLKCHSIETNPTSHWILDHSGQLGRDLHHEVVQHKPPFAHVADFVLPLSDESIGHLEKLFPLLTHHFWTSLMSRDTYSLWPILKSGFNTPTDEEFDEVCSLFSGLLTMQQAIMRQEPMFTFNIDEVFYDTLRLVSYVDDDFAAWIYETSSVPNLMSTYPLHSLN